MIKKIKEVSVFGSFELPDGKTLHNVFVRFDDGYEGLAYSNSDNPPYSAGDWAEVTLKTDDSGQEQKTKKGKPKIKVRKTDSPEKTFEAPPASSGKSSKQSLVETVYSGVTRMVATGVVSDEDFNTRLRDDYDWLAFLCGLEESKPPPEEQKKEENEEDLPF
jgi:hypothetical protein